MGRTLIWTSWVISDLTASKACVKAIGGHLFALRLPPHRKKRVSRPPVATFVRLTFTVARVGLPSICYGAEVLQRTRQLFVIEIGIIGNR